jgi:release factor glutamine methyltransferase
MYNSSLMPQKYLQFMSIRNISNTEMQHYYLLLQLMNFRQSEQYFITETAQNYGREESQQVFELIIEHLTGWSRSVLFLHKDDDMNAGLQSQFDEIVAVVKKGVPVQHILAEAWFYGTKFKVNSSVLIPRPETEELVDWILHDLAAVSGSKTADITRILDIGTGSGCIAISLEKLGRGVQADAMDISAAALLTAKENAVLNGSEVNFIQHDITQPWCDPAGIRTLYDVIVSNPPYIKEDERTQMHSNVLDYEPHLALFVTNDNPLIFYKAIADFALEHLQPHGHLYFEINEYLGKETVDMLKDKSFTDIILKKDMQGKDRMIRCKL